MGRTRGVAAVAGSVMASTILSLTRPKQVFSSGSASTVPDLDGVPSVKDLTDWVFFAPASGRIWFDKQRTLLMHAGTFGAMRREIIQALGLDQGASVLKRIGYAQGQRDAELVRGRWPAHHLAPHLSAGPQLHTLEGFVKVTAPGWTTDAEYGFHGEYIWTDSVEADEHVATFGPSPRRYAGRWLGYAAGYGGVIHGKPVMVEEIECVAAGHQHCRAFLRLEGPPPTAQKPHTSAAEMSCAEKTFLLRKASLSSAPPLLFLCRATLEKCEGNVALAARHLGITRPTLEVQITKVISGNQQRRGDPPRVRGSPAAHDLVLGRVGGVELRDDAAQARDQDAVGNARAPRAGRRRSPPPPCPRRPAGGSAHGSPGWCRHRRRASARRRMMICGSCTSDFAITTFCWLPPDSSTILALRCSALIFSRSTQ